MNHGIHSNTPSQAAHLAATSFTQEAKDSGLFRGLLKFQQIASPFLIKIGLQKKPLELQNAPLPALTTGEHPQVSVSKKESDIVEHIQKNIMSENELGVAADRLVDTIMQNLDESGKLQGKDEAFKQDLRTYLKNDALKILSNYSTFDKKMDRVEKIVPSILTGVSKVLDLASGGPIGGIVAAPLTFGANLFRIGQKAFNAVVNKDVSKKLVNDVNVRDYDVRILQNVFDKHTSFVRNTESGSTAIAALNLICKAGLYVGGVVAFAVGATTGVIAPAVISILSGIVIVGTITAKSILFAVTRPERLKSKNPVKVTPDFFMKKKNFFHKRGIRNEMANCLNKAIKTEAKNNKIGTRKEALRSLINNSSSDKPMILDTTKLMKTLNSKSIDSYVSGKKSVQSMIDERRDQNINDFCKAKGIDRDNFKNSMKQLALKKNLSPADQAFIKAILKIDVTHSSFINLEPDVKVALFEKKGMDYLGVGHQTQNQMMQKLSNALSKPLPKAA